MTSKLLPLKIGAACFAVALASACMESSIAPTLPAPNASLSTMSMTSCGASFRLIANEQDDLMAQYGIPNTVDTVDVCESWTGNDYQYQATAIGSSDNDPVLIDSVQTTTYQSGVVTGYTPAGNFSTSSQVGSTAFDMLFADDATRQASYDYPYYGVSSPDPGACLQPPCPVMTVIAPDKSPISNKSATGNADLVSTPAFVKHGLSRRGIRALVDDAREISRSPEGHRRFESMFRGQTVVRSLEPKTQLLVGEMVADAADTTWTTHVWVAVPGGYVRDHSDYETVETINGRKFRSRGHLVFQKVRVSDPLVLPLVGPDIVP